jgi:hypothetical protein
MVGYSYTTRKLVLVGSSAGGYFPGAPSTGPVGMLLLMQPDQEVISGWRDSAPFWEKHREIIRQMFAPVTQALVEDGLISSGHAVRDIATGPGEPALTIAALVGSEGEVFGIDPAPEMVDASASDRPSWVQECTIRRRLCRPCAVPRRYLRCCGQPLRSDVFSISC